MLYISVVKIVHCTKAMLFKYHYYLCVLQILSFFCYAAICVTLQTLLLLQDRTVVVDYRFTEFSFNCP